MKLRSRKTLWVVFSVILTAAVGLLVFDFPSEHYPSADLGGIRLKSLNRQGFFFPEHPTPRETLLNFWAPWCEPCRQEIPLLNRLALTSRMVRDHRLAIVGIALDTRQPVKRFLAQNKVVYPVFVVPKEEGAFVARFHITLIGLPITLLLNRKNQILARHLGQLSPQSLSAILAEHSN